MAQRRIDVLSFTLGTEQYIVVGGWRSERQSKLGVRNEQHARNAECEAFGREISSDDLGESTTGSGGAGS